jgi:DNA-binding MarR family transcriptional regulator
MFKEPIEDCLIFLLSKANQQVQQLTRDRLEPHGITPTQYAVLRVLWEQDGQTAAALGERLQLDAATLVGVLDRLSQAALIKRQPDTKDRRVNHIILTPKGKTLEKLLAPNIAHINRTVESRFSKQDVKKLRKLLSELRSVKKAGVS